MFRSSWFTDFDEPQIKMNYHLLVNAHLYIELQEYWKCVPLNAFTTAPENVQTECVQICRVGLSSGERVNAHVHKPILISTVNTCRLDLGRANVLLLLDK